MRATRRHVGGYLPVSAAFLSASVVIPHLYAVSLPNILHNLCIASVVSSYLDHVKNKHRIKKYNCYSICKSNDITKTRNPQKSETHMTASAKHH